MRFAIICHDKPGQADARAENRDAHFAYLDRFEFNIVEAGPFLADDGTHSVGSLLIVDFATREETEAFAAGDPFAQAGIFESVTIMPYKKLLPKSFD